MGGSHNPACIYCGSSGPFSAEHTMPVCLGEFRGFPPLTNRVCSRCNNQIGRLERHFCRGASPESFFRQRAGIKGRRTHKKHNPFREGVGSLGPLEVRIRDPATGDRVLWEFIGHDEVQYVPQIVLRDKDGGRQPILISPTMDPEELKSRVEAAGPDCDVDYLNADPEDHPWIKRLLAGIGKQMTGPAEPRRSVRFREPVTVQVRVGPEYFRAIAKIGFHYFLAASSVLQGDEKELEPLRGFILEGGDVESHVKWRKRPILPEVPAVSGHVALAMWEQVRIKVYLQFFLSPDWPRPTTYCVQITDRLPQPLQGRGFIGHLFAYYPGGRSGRCWGQAVQIESRS